MLVLINFLPSKTLIITSSINFFIILPSTDVHLWLPISDKLLFSNAEAMFPYDSSLKLQYFSDMH